MSVLCCHIPDFLIRVHRHHAGNGDPPLALVGGDDQVWAVSTRAQALGVAPGMTPQQARMRCPELRLCPLEMGPVQAAQMAFQAELQEWALPVELADWGLAYLDLHEIAGQEREVRPLGQELGRRLRQQLGEALQPALGWDSGKFTARLAAVRARPGHLKLVPQARERAFLQPLPVTLLPLPQEAIQQLHWLGIRTLGQFGALPQVAVWQRFGSAGKLAWRWARGQDDRPVQPSPAERVQRWALSFHPPQERLPPVLAQLMALLTPHLTQLAAHLQGVRRLHLALRFLGGATRAVHLVCLETVDRPARLEALLAPRLRAVPWPSPLEELQVTLLETGEAPLRQAALFPEFQEGPEEAPGEAPWLAGLRELVARHGPVLYRASLAEASHPLPERRACVDALALDP